MPDHADIREDRLYPARPLVGVGAVVVVEPGRVVLVKRKYDPLKGRWTLPGGMIELGERARPAIAREVREETGLSVDVGVVIEAVDHIETDADQRTAYHFVIVDYLCRPTGTLGPTSQRLGPTSERLVAGSDVDDVCLADPRDLGRYDLTERTHAVIGRGIELYTLSGRHS